MSELQIETIVEESRWTVVTSEGEELYRAPKPGHTKAARRKCERWVEGQSRDINYYRESAARTAKADEFVASLKGRHAPGTIPRRPSW